jgi:AP-1 complex subunit beta-1
VFYFAANFTLEAMFTADGALERASFINSWKSIADTNEIYATVSDLPTSDVDAVINKLATSNIFFIARRPVPNQPDQE